MVDSQRHSEALMNAAALLDVPQPSGRFSVPLGKHNSSSLRPEERAGDNTHALFVSNSAALGNEHDMSSPNPDPKLVDCPQSEHHIIQAAKRYVSVVDPLNATETSLSSMCQSYGRRIEKMRPSCWLSTALGGSR